MGLCLSRSSTNHQQSPPPSPPPTTRTNTRRTSPSSSSSATIGRTTTRPLSSSATTTTTHTRRTTATTTTRTRTTPYSFSRLNSQSSQLSLPSPRPPQPTVTFAANAPNPTPPPPPNPTHPSRSPKKNNGLSPLVVTAKRIKSDVNVLKDTIRVVVDEMDLESHLVSFTFDALADGCITIFYFAKEGANCTFTPLYPEIHMPRRIPFQKGLGQKFCQPSSTGLDLGFFVNDLSKPSPREDVFPLVICAEIYLPPLSMDVQPNSRTLSHAQITQAVLQKSNEGHFQVRVIKQILWVDGVRYELREIYGIDNSDKADFEVNEQGKECVICLTEPKDTAALPCRHMCMCSSCAKEFRKSNNKCPICRQLIQELIKINTASS